MARALLSDSEPDSSDSEAGGAEVSNDLKVNQDFAKRFEHNKKREELQKLEEKLGKSSRKRKRGDEDNNGSDSESSSSSEDEDDEGEFATAALDNEIMATLEAIKSKDPRVYDTSVKFYADADQELEVEKQKKEKPVYLRDYHRENLLNGVKHEEQEDQPLSYNQQQDQLKKSIVSEMHAAANASSDEDSDEEGGLLVRKSKPEVPTQSAVIPDVETADRDPETFLSNFMAARAWVPTDRAELHPFESDDEEEEKRAEEFEEAYNMRFENPEKSNEALRSYARDTAAKFSVRREDKNSRKKMRDAEKAAKEAAKQEIRDEKARLKKLRMDEVEQKVKRIKQAAGLRSTDLKPEDWSRFIDDEWDDAKWEDEMQKRFGDQYYAEQDDELSDASLDGEQDNNPTTKKHKKPHKPKFDDDIDIKDIIPDFQEEDEEAANFSLSDDDDNDNNNQTPATKQKPKSKSKKQERIATQKETRRERRIIEALVTDQMQLDLDHALPASSRQKSAGFRYRETSPQSFGLTSRDILLADDSALNQFAGLKKLASWREEEKKQKDRKRLGKKARLRKWRMDTFGDEEGPREVDNDGQDREDGEVRAAESDDEVGGVDIREGGKKKKGRRRKKTKTDGVVLTA
ncbi:Kinetochore protein Spc24 [Lithohypha guttulata]|uniref:Kinetochore protein Spc24 n=1 Tax=Lithohypha guttulata TaxID=1690604 RepID=A0AAN7Y8X2_9EURO|nr:Kinetochore protein Spc24 [Lithohypha guttulata]